MMRANLQLRLKKSTFMLLHITLQNLRKIMVKKIFFKYLRLKYLIIRRYFGLSTCFMTRSITVNVVLSYINSCFSFYFKLKVYCHKK